MARCLVCDSGVGHLTLCTQKGLKTITEFAKKLKDEQILSRLKEEGDFSMHRDCQKKYVNKRRLLNTCGNAKSASTRSQASSFCLKSQCLFCEGRISAKSKPWSKVKTNKFCDPILKTCHSRLSTFSEDSVAVNVK